MDALENLSPAIIVDQERMGANARSTVGTATDVHAMLRILFSRIGQPHVGSPQAFSFNIPSVKGAGAVTFEQGGKKVKERRSFEITGGMCPRCEGLGEVSDVDLDELFDSSKSLAEGAITIPGYNVDGWMVRGFTESGFVDPDKPIKDYTEQERQDFLYKEPTKVKIQGINMTYEGLVPKITKSFLQKDRDSLQPHIRAFVERAVKFTACPDCGGTRLNEGARSSKISGINIADAAAMQISDLAAWLRTVEDPEVAPLMAGLRDTIDSFVDIGLGYLSLDRACGTLSGGEAQRTKMIRHLGSSAHRHHLRLRRADRRPAPARHRAHERAAPAAARQGQHRARRRAQARGHRDRRPRRRPRAGRGPRRGRDQVHRRCRRAPRLRHASRAATSTTARAAQAVDPRAEGCLEIRGATQHNLKSVDVDIPLGILTVVTGVAGSGKSSLIHGNVPAFDDVVVVDQAADQGIAAQQPGHLHGPARRHPRGLREGERRQARVLQRELRRRVPRLQGARRDHHRTGLHPDRRDALRGVRGHRASATRCSGTSSTARTSPRCSRCRWPRHPSSSPKGPAQTMLARMIDVGLGYITLGQALNTLSGGERQRLKLAISMAKKGAIYVLDEPTTGLHLADVDNMLAMLDRLVDAGNSVIVIEHHQAVMAHADWIIDLGPGAGHDGGEIVFEGAPADLVAKRENADRDAPAAVRRRGE